MKSYTAGSTDKLPLAAKLIYGWGDLYGGGALNLVGFYYLIFLTDVCRIDPAWAGLVILVSKVWDAVSDPMMGAITDRTRTRLGKRRPYFIVNIFSVVVGMAVLWYAPPFAREGFRFLYALFAYLLFSTVSTVLMVPYLSLMPSLARDYDERTSLNAVKMAFSFFAGIFAAVLPMQIVHSFADARSGYLAMALAAGLFFSVPWVFISLYFREPDSRADAAGGARFDIAEFLAPLRIRSFRYSAGIYLGAYLVLDLMSALIAYFMTYVLGRPGDLKIVLGVLILSQLASMPPVSALSRRLGKAGTAVLCSAVWIASIAFIAFSPVSWPAWVIYVQAAVTGFGVCGALVMPWSMYPDVADVGRLALGKDCSGELSGLMTFFRKFASAFALFVVGLVLRLSGYAKPEERIADGVRTLVNQAQPDSSLLAIRALLCAAPLLLLGGVIVLASRYPLSAAAHALVRRRLDAPEGAPAELTEAEEALLRSLS